MKTFLIIFSLIIALLPSKTLSLSAASNPTTYYARIKENEACYFYSSPFEQSKLFVLPSTFFVIISGQENDFYKARFRDVDGYVKMNSVTPVEGKPTQEYPNTSFRVINENGLIIYSLPTNEAEPIGSLESLQEGVTLYGTMSGKMIIPRSTDVWFYCSTYQDGRYVKGYVFSYLCDEVVKAGRNDENLKELSTPLDFTSHTDVSTGLSDTVVAIIVLSICLPCLVILYLLLSPAKRRKGAKVQKAVKIKRGKDYYELNEDDL